MGEIYSYLGEDMNREWPQNWNSGWTPTTTLRVAGAALLVTGADIDSVAPMAASITVSATDVDTLPADATLIFDIVATDVGDGVFGVGLHLEGTELATPAAGTFLSGTRNDGVWRPS